MRNKFYIDDKDITFVVSGRFLQNDISNLILLRKYFPESEILLCTWTSDFELLKKDSQSKIKKLVTKTILTKDPKSEVRDVYTGRSINYIRQLTSFSTSMNHISRKYVIKIRADLFFRDNKLLINRNLYEDLENNKIIVLNITSVNPKRWRGRAMPFHICDWFYMGKKDIMCNFFSQPMVSEKSFIKFKTSKIENDGDINISDISIFSPEQLIVLLSPKFRDLKIQLSQYNFDQETLKFSDIMVAKFFAIKHAYDLSLRSTKYKVNSLFYQYYMYQYVDFLSDQNIFLKLIKINFLIFLYIKHLFARAYFILRRIYYIH